jgi:hypothetical protein
MIRFLMILALAVMVFAAARRIFPQATTPRARHGPGRHRLSQRDGRIAMASAAMRRSTLEAGQREYPDPRPEVLFPTGR